MLIIYTIVLMRNIYFTVTALLLATLIYGQDNTSGTKISGTVSDANTRSPVEYATIAILDLTTGKTVNGATVNAKGAFSVHNIPYGTYKVTIDFIGYTPQVKNQVTLNAAHPAADLGRILLMPAGSNNLQQVVVTARAPVVQNKVDKIVYNVTNDVTSQGGVAIDVLKKVPQVNVDIDGNVELQGNSNIRFLINGKPSSMFGNSLADALASIPASQIKSIEAITTPGAKYDAQGTGGIINIILRDNKMQGINGNINLSAGTRLENGALSLNFRHNNLGIHSFFNGNAQLVSKTPFRQNRTSGDSTGAVTRLLQDGYNNFNRNGYQAGIGFDWSPSKQDNITTAFSYNHFANKNDGWNSQESQTQDKQQQIIADLFSYRNSNSHARNNSFDWSVDYTHKFRKDGQTLDIRYDASYGDPFSYYFQSQAYKNQQHPYTGSFSNNPGKDRQTEIAIDYTHPVNDKIQLETGVKTILQDISSIADVQVLNPDAGQFLYDPKQSYTLHYKMRVYAGYISGSFRLLNYLDVKAGLRYEYTHLAIDFPNTTIPSYGTWMPSIIFSHQFGNDQTVKLAFTRRIERPEYRELNPFLNLSDPYNITTGNPLLKPEIGKNFELGYARRFNKGGNIYIGLMERINSNDIKPYTLFYPSYQVGDSVYQNVSVTNRQNVGREYNTGLIITGSVPLTKALTIRENFMVFNRHVVNDLNNGAITNGLNWRLNINAGYQFPHNLVVEAFGDFRSSFKNVQGMQAQQLSYTFAFRKQFWNKNASLGITATNPFSRYINQVTTVVTNNYNSYYLRQVPYRSFGISFTYKFGKLEFKKNKDNDNYLNNPPDMGSN